jgi:cytochrome c biogenesis protein
MSKAIYELLSSMRFAVTLLTVLGIASVIGTVLKQNEPYANYVVQFGQFWFGLFEMLGLYDVYHSVWFLLILLFLVLSTSLCIYRNTPGMLRELRAFREHASETSLRSFGHRAEYVYSGESQGVLTQLQGFLAAHGFRFKSEPRVNGDVLLAAKAGSYQRLGYILTHSAIVIICIGGLLDGNVPFKLQEVLGYKQVETRDLAAAEVPEASRLSVANLSFRANMTLPEGAQGNAAFMRMRDGYLLQELPFTVVLKDFRIEHYATGQPKSFESDVEILDTDLAKPLKATISVNHPLIYKGIAIYQSDFQDGGSRLDFNAWPLFSGEGTPDKVSGRVFEDIIAGEGDMALRIEFEDFRFFNILTLDSGPQAKPRNVGPSVTFRLRNSQGQAREYLNYMQPMTLEGRAYFVSGMRETQNQDYRYLRIPADANNSIDDYMRLHAVLFDAAQTPHIASRLAAKVLPDTATVEMRGKFQNSVQQLLGAFAKGGYTRVAEVIEEAVPEAEREKAAQTYLKIVGNASFEALVMSRELAGLAPPQPDDATLQFLHDSLNSMSDLFFYGAPFFLQLTDFEHKQASGFQLTRSPGKNLVYAGSLLLVLGIFAMIYLRERRIWLLVKPGLRQVLFAMSASRKSRDFEFEFARYRQQLQALLEG